MQFSGKFGVFTPPLEGSRPPLGKILDPPLKWVYWYDKCNWRVSCTTCCFEDLPHWHDYTRLIDVYTLGIDLPCVCIPQKRYQDLSLWCMWNLPSTMMKNFFIVLRGTQIVAGAGQCVLKIFLPHLEPSSCAQLVSDIADNSFPLVIDFCWINLDHLLNRITSCDMFH